VRPEFGGRACQAIAAATARISSGRSNVEFGGETLLNRIARFDLQGCVPMATTCSLSADPECGARPGRDPELLLLPGTVDCATRDDPVGEKLPILRIPWAAFGENILFVGGRPYAIDARGAVRRKDRSAAEGIGSEVGVSRKGREY